MKIEERTFPSVDQLEKELDKVQYRKRFGKVFRGTVFYLVVVAALAVLVAVLVLPMLQILGSSMSDTCRHPVGV